MALQSGEIPLGTPAPDFSLPDPRTGKTHSLQELRGEKGTVVIFMCNHCPYVKLILDKLLEVAREYTPKGIAFVGINSNDPVNYPEDAPEKMKELAEEKDFPFPYLFDESQEVARRYQAQCTPEFYVFDQNLRLYYHGQFDDARPGNDQPVTGESLREALNRLLQGEAPPIPQKPAVGCSIKWKA